MNHTAKLLAEPQIAEDEEAMDDMDGGETTAYFEFAPEAEGLSDEAILADDFLDDFDDFDSSDVLGEHFGFIPGED